MPDLGHGFDAGLYHGQAFRGAVNAHFRIGTAFRRVGPFDELFGQSVDLVDTDLVSLAMRLV